MDNPILATLADLLSRQITVNKIEMGPDNDGVRQYTFHCANSDSTTIDVKGSREEIVALHKQTRAYWDTFKLVSLPDPDSSS